MTTRVITPPSMDINRDIGSQNCPDAQPSVVAIPEVEGAAAGLPESAGVPITTHHSLGCPSPAISPNSTMMGPGTELILSTRIRSVPRCLFGPPDPHAGQFARERVKEIREQDKRRYNFDFDQEQPLEGPFKWEPVQVTAPTTKSNSGSGSFPPKAYALSRFPYLSGNMVQIDRGNISPPPVRTTINNNQLPPTRQLYFQPDLQEEREPLLIARPLVSPTSTFTTTARPLTSVIKSPSSTVIYPQSAMDTSASRVPPVDPTMLLPSPEASSCSSEDSANVADVEMELEDEEEIATSVESSSTEDDSNVLRQSSSKLQSTSSSSPAAVATILHHTISSSTSSGLSSRLGNSNIRSSSSGRRTKSVSSSSSSPSASPSSPTSSQPPITRFLPVRKRPASSTTTKAASESAPTSAAAPTEAKRTAK